MATPPVRRGTYGRYRTPDPEGHVKLHLRVRPSARGRAEAAAKALGWSLSRYFEALIDAQMEGMTIEAYLERQAEQEAQGVLDLEGVVTA